MNEAYVTEKWAKDMNTQVTKDDVKVATKRTKRCSTSFTIKRETKAKHDFSQKVNPPHHTGKGAGKRWSHALSVVMQRDTTLKEGNLAIPNRTTYVFAFGSSNPIPGNSPSNYASNNLKIYRQEYIQHCL